MDNLIVASLISLKNTELTYDIIFDIMDNIKKRNKAILNFEKVNNKIYFIINRVNITKLAYSIHNMGYKSHIIAREFLSLGEYNTSQKVHKVGKYYHNIGENLLKEINNLYQRWLSLGAYRIGLKSFNSDI